MHVVEERAWIRTRGTRRCSRFRGERLKPDSAISPNSFRLVPAGGIEPPRRMTLRFECSAPSHFARPAHLLVGAGGVEPPSPKALDSKSSASSSSATLPQSCWCFHVGTRRGSRTLTLLRAQHSRRCVSPIPPSGNNSSRHSSPLATSRATASSYELQARGAGCRT